MKILLALVVGQLMVSSYGMNIFDVGQVQEEKDLGVLLADSGAVRGPLSPVVLIPGSAGSRLYAHLDKPSVVNPICQKKTYRPYHIWLNKLQMLPFVVDCWADNLRLEYDPVARKTVDRPGVNISVPGWGYVHPVEWTDPAHSWFTGYFVNVVNALVRIGYKRDFSIRGAPYDFRKAMQEHEDFFVELKYLIEETYETNNQTTVTLILHSMGGPMTLNFLHRQSQEWKDKYIRRLISLSGAWGGDMGSLQVYTVGEDFGLITLKNELVKKMMASMSSIAYLMPNPLFWKPDQVLVSTNEREYTVNDFEAFYKAIDYPHGWEMYQDAFPHTQNFTAPGIEVHCFYGSDVKTIERMDFGKSLDLSGRPSITYGPGDGMINERSLEACKIWEGEQQQPIHVKNYPRVNHNGMLTDRNVLRDVVNVLTGGS